MAAKRYIALLAVLFTIWTGCGRYERTLKLDARLSVPPAIGRMPLSIGLYYSPGFIEFTQRVEVMACGSGGRKMASGIFFSFPLGAASRDLFDQIAASLFQTVMQVPDFPLPTDASGAPDGILAPEIASFEWGMTCPQNSLSGGNTIVSIGYEISLYGRDGRLVASMPVRGSAFEKPGFCLENCRDSRATEQAMQDAMAVFILEFFNRQEIKQWIADCKASSANAR